MFSEIMHLTTDIPMSIAPLFHVSLVILSYSCTLYFAIILSGLIPK